MVLIQKVCQDYHIDFETMILACATCKADPNSVIAQAQDLAVLVMIAFLMVGLGCVALIVYNFVRKQRLLSETTAV
jgi:hypothetical protein